MLTQSNPGVWWSLLSNSALNQVIGIICRFSHVSKRQVLRIGFIADVTTNKALSLLLGFKLTGRSTFFPVWM